MSMKQDITNLVQRIATLEQSFRLCQEHVVTLQIINRNLKKEIANLQESKHKIFDLIYNLEKNNIMNNQYSRRENIEIVNLPESLSIKQLEPKIIEIINDFGISLSSFDIVATHRIGKKYKNKPRNVIIRFINRKNVYHILNKSSKFSASAKKFGYDNVYVRENLCPDNRKIFNKCYKLKKDGILKYVRTVNGFVNVGFQDDDYDIELLHFDDIRNLLDEYTWFEDYPLFLNEFSSIRKPVR